jgi:hypothetical protein
MSLLVIFYWILLLLWAIGAFSAASWPHWPYANAFILLILFIISVSKFPETDVVRWNAGGLHKRSIWMGIVERAVTFLVALVIGAFFLAV